MSSKLFCSVPLHRSLFLKTSSYFRFSFSNLAENNVSNSNAPLENLFAQFVTTRLNISSGDAAKMLKKEPTLGRLKTLDKVEQLVDMLNRHGCTKDQIANIIRVQPSLMTTSAEMFMEPKIQLLKDFGVERENIPKIVTISPNILASKLETLRANLEFLKTVLPTNDFLVRAIMRTPYIIVLSLQNVLKPSVAFWECFGFHGIEFIKFLLCNPRALMRISLSPEQLDFIRKTDIHKESKMYKYVVSIVANRRIQVLEAKIDNLQLCGLSPEEAWELVRVDPSILNKSEESIKKKMDFMLNNMGLSVEFVAKHPRMFSMSLDKVMRPRFLVLQNMAAMNGPGEGNRMRLHAMLMMTEAKFVAQIIESHPESAALWTVYKNAIADVSKSSKINSAGVSNSSKIKRFSVA